MAQHNNHGGKRPQSTSQHHNTKFENPYNFVAAIPRDTKHEELGDHAPAGHHRYHPQQWSGRLSVTMTTVTPLLIPDQPVSASNDHKTFGIRTDASGNPYLPPTSIKGALRAAYEAITNSRMGIFSGHNTAFGYWIWKGKAVRKYYEQPPANLLHESIKPATKCVLSPADRVFGWVKDGGQGQHKGQLRIGPVNCDQGQDAIERVGGQVGLPLAILGAPKPAQARFYAAKDGSGTPYDRGTAKDAMYRKGQGLRGRKVYPHHKLAATAHGYWNTNPRWDEPLTTETGRKVFREWLRAGNTRDSQNRSITAWVKPGSTFHFDIDITNLSAVEVGALLWLLTLDDDCHFRLGSAKPLGFGSTKMELSAMDLRDGAAIRASYIGFGAGAEGKHLTSPEHAKELVEAYKQALCTVGTPPVRRFEDHPIIKAYLNASRGGNVPVHYPRTTERPNPKGENFKWFVANEKTDRNSLPSLAENDPQRHLQLLKG